MPAHASIGNIVRGLADAPYPEGRGAERVNNLKEYIYMDDVDDVGDKVRWI